MNEPHNLSQAIARVQIALLAQLNWIQPETLFGRVHDQLRTVAGADKPVLLPMHYDGDGEYRLALPDDTRRSVVFFRAADVEKSDFDRARHSDPRRIRATRHVSLYGWVNANKFVDPQTSFPDETGYIELLKTNLKAALKPVGCVIRIGDWQDGPIEEVFRPYDVSSLRGKYDRYPYACFRLELTLMMIEP